MNVPDEVPAYLRALVWPGVAVIALITFRRQVAGLIPRIREVSAAGASVKFGEQAATLADEASRMVQRLPGEQTAAHPQDLLPATPKAEPTLVFLGAYRELEAAAKDAGPAAHVAAAAPVPVIRGLAGRAQVPAEAVRIAEQLRRIRNEVAHGARRLEPVDAENLVIAARSLAAMCRAAAESQTPSPASAGVSRG